MAEHTAKLDCSKGFTGLVLLTEYVKMLLLFLRVQRRFQQFFSHITTVSGCDRELNVHFYSGASLKYHAPDN